MSKGIPAALGGIKAFPEGLPFSRPTIPPYGTFEEDLKEIFASGVVTKGPWLAAYEKKISDHLGAEHCLGVSSCTLGLVLVVKALGLTGRVVMPSFTFFSTLHALVWNGV
jgi:dTDP-4-amino-4,6-dideoxygalactose transaminase